MPLASTPGKRKLRGVDTKPSGDDDLPDILEDIANMPEIQIHRKQNKSRGDKGKRDERTTKHAGQSTFKYKLILNDSNDENGQTEASLEVRELLSGKLHTKYIIDNGDYVLVRSAKGEQFVAQTFCFYENQFSKQLTASVKWFFIPAEVPGRLLSKDTHPKEIFYGTVQSADDIDVETICGKCSVTWLDPSAPITKENTADFDYFYRRSFNGKKLENMPAPPTKKILKKSAAASLNTIASPKRARQTPGKYLDYEQDTPKVKRQVKNSTTVNNTPHSRVRRSARNFVLPNTPVKMPDTSSQVDNKVLTSPVSASNVGRFEASEVALDILSRSDDEDDDALSVFTSTSESSEVSKASSKGTVRKAAVKQGVDQDDGRRNISRTRKSTATPAVSRTRRSTATPAVSRTRKSTATPAKKHATDGMAEPTLAAAESIKNSPPKQQKLAKLVISIPRIKAQHCRVAQLVESSQKPRSSPRRLNTPRPILRDGSGSEASSDTDENWNSDDDDEESDGDEESDAEFVLQQRSPRRSRSSKKAPMSSARRSSRTPRVKTTVTPIVIKMPRNRTPFIPARQTPVRKAKGSLELSRERLHVSAVPDCLPCRESEFQEIYNFVEGKVRSGGGGCIYVSGVPGTGKTATVREVINILRQSADEGDITDFKYIDINGMRLTEPRQAYVKLLSQLTGQKATADHAADLLCKLFAQRRKTATVVLADELDLLWTKKQDVLYHLFDWPTHRHARLIVVAIANTMDLPERILMNRVSSRLGLTRLTFRPYTFKQLQEIILSRLHDLNSFEADAIQLASRKVAAVSGDARRCLDICRRATEIAIKSKAKVVSIEHVHSALQEMFATPMVQAIRGCSKHEQLFLHSIVAEFRKSGLEECTLGRVVQQHTAISQLEGLPPVSVTTLMQICYRLASSRLILLESGQRQLFTRLRLNVSIDDVLFALK